MSTMFLALIIGWYLVIVSLFMLFQYEHARSVIADVLAHRGLFFIVAIITIIIGLILVVSHNYWVMGWPTIITVISWLILISGLLRLFLPDVAIKMANTVISNPMNFRIMAVINLIIGVFLIAWRYYSYTGGPGFF